MSVFNKDDVVFVVFGPLNETNNPYGDAYKCMVKNGFATIKDIESSINHDIGIMCGKLDNQVIRKDTKTFKFSFARYISSILKPDYVTHTHIIDNRISLSTRLHSMYIMKLI